MVLLSNMTEETDAQQAAKPAAPHDYFVDVAEARYILRRVFRIAEEQAKAAGLEPLTHQALIQIYGSPERRLRVNGLAERLDIKPAFASAMLTRLEADGLIYRQRDTADHRVTWVQVTETAVEKLVQIDSAVDFHVRYFAAQLDRESRERALSTLKFYVGLGD